MKGLSLIVLLNERVSPSIKTPYGPMMKQYSAI